MVFLGIAIIIIDNIMVIIIIKTVNSTTYIYYTYKCKFDAAYIIGASPNVAIP